MRFLKGLRKSRNDDEEAGLREGLMSDATREIELSEYGQLGGESPSRFLNGDGPNSEPIADLDLFFERLYSYYCERGLWCIITKWVVELLSLGFTICFSGFVLLFVDWTALRHVNCGVDSPCDLVKEAIRPHPLTPLTITSSIIVGYLVLFSAYWVFCFFRFFAQLRDVLTTRDFYFNCLRVSDNDIKTMPWATVLDKVVAVQTARRLCVVKDLSEQDIVMRIMRKENYLIGMINKGVLAFPMWVPGAGPEIRSGNYLILSKTLEWTLNWCILQSMFDRNFYVKMEFISNPKTLKKRVMVVGAAMLLLSPFLVIFMLVYLFLRHAEQFYNHPTTASSRRWSNIARWMFREFNEVDHLFRHRINGSLTPASEYLRQFPSPMISIVAKLVSFVAGGFAAMLIIVAFLEESLLEGHIFGRNLLWYAAVFGTITAISRAAATEDLLVLDPQGTMAAVVKTTHYMPKHWRTNESTVVVKKEFEALFQYTGMMLLEEMASIFVTPFLLLFVLPKRVESILQFIADFTVHVDGVGHVCSFSSFSFRSHGNSNYGSPYNASKAQRSRQGKMEKSFCSFRSSYPMVEPNEEGKKFLVNLKKFGDKSVGMQNCRHRRRNMQWVIEEEETNLTDLVESYYVDHRRRWQGSPPQEYLDSGELWLPRDLTIAEEEWSEEENFNLNSNLSLNLNVNLDRVMSSIGASASTAGDDSFPLLQSRSQWMGGSIDWMGASTSDSIPHRGNWWDRDRDGAPSEAGASFLEPPQFAPRAVRYYDSLLESTSHDDAQSNSMFPEPFPEEDGGESGGRSTPLLHFDDVYHEPPQLPTTLF